MNKKQAKLNQISNFDEVESKNKSRKYATIFDVPIDSNPKRVLLDKIEVYLKKGRVKNLIIVTPNPEILLESKKNKVLSNFLKNADISIPDGVGTAWAYKMLNGKHTETIKGRLFMEDLLVLANNLSQKVFLYGSTDETIEKALNKAKLEFPNLNITGESGPRLTNEAEPSSNRDVKKLDYSLNKMKKFKPDILFVALGAPKQELFISKYINSDLKSVVMTVGGALDYFAGTKKSPPKFMSDSFEWVWRGMNEPGHLKRIFNAVFAFPLEVFKHKILGR